jgi:hypothetical protein
MSALLRKLFASELKENERPQVRLSPRPISFCSLNFFHSQWFFWFPPGSDKRTKKFLLKLDAVVVAYGCLSYCSSFSVAIHPGR